MNISEAEADSELKEQNDGVRWGKDEGRGRGIARDLGWTCCTAVFKMCNQQRSYCVIHGALLNVLWLPGWEQRVWESGYMYVYG